MLENQYQKVLYEILSCDDPFSGLDIRNKVIKKSGMIDDKDLSNNVFKAIDSLINYGILEYGEIGKNNWKYFINKEKKPFSSLSCISFLNLLVLIMKVYGIRQIDYKELEEFIIECKKDKMFDNLLDDLVIYNDGDSEYIPNLLQAIMMAIQNDMLVIEDRSIAIPISTSCDGPWHQIIKNINKIHIKELAYFLEEYYKVKELNRKILTLQH